MVLKKTLPVNKLRGLPDYEVEAILRHELAVKEGKIDLNRACDFCGQWPELEYHGYSSVNSNIILCRNCGLQLSRKLLEDLCELITGDRHG